MWRAATGLVPPHRSTPGYGSSDPQPDSFPRGSARRRNHFSQEVVLLGPVVGELETPHALGAGHEDIDEGVMTIVSSTASTGFSLTAPVSISSPLRVSC
jgi:hypothetical protein